MYEDILPQQHGLGDGIRQMFNPVGGGPFPYMRTRDVGVVQYGDVVIAQADHDEALDQQQDYFADDMITSGDEGIGFAQARRLKAKLRGNRRRITTRGYAVEGGAPYQFEGFSFKKMFTHPFGKQSLFQKGGRLAIKVAPYVAGGVVGGALLKKGIPALFKLGKKVIGGGGQPVAVATESPDNVPAPAPTGSTDAVGAPIPAAIQQAMATAASPIPAAAPTASEDVASQAQDAETVNTMEAGVGFGMPNFSDPKVLLTLAALGVFAFTQLGKGKGRSRRRR